jgi:hypothetical protein
MSKFNYVWNYMSSTISDFKVRLLGYRSYKALLYQTGTDAPVPTVVENTLNINPEYLYSVEGVYLLRANRDLFNGPVIGINGEPIEVIITPSDIYWNETKRNYTAIVVDSNTVEFKSLKDFTPNDDELGINYPVSIEIRIYNK